jgi:tetratricopeptide (TPR) repeat protein
VRDPSRARRFLFVRAFLRSAVVGLLLAVLVPCSLTLAGPAASDLAAVAERGRAAMAAGRFAEAAQLYAEIVRALPDEPGMLLNLGMALSMAGRPREAVGPLEAALKRRPDLAPASLFLGQARMDLGEPARAVKPLETFLTAQPENRDARRILADALFALRRLDEAAREYRKLTELDPQDPKAWYGLGRSYQLQAQGALAGLQTSAPESIWVALLVADGLVVQERDTGAFVLYREALEKRPDLAEAREALARIYDRKNHPEWAAVEREKARAIPPPECRTPSLECDFRAGRLREVVEAARRLGTAESRYWLSRATNELAHEAFGRLEKLPPSPEAVLVRVEVLRSQRRYAESKEALQKASASWPDDARLRHELATLLLIGHELETARPLLEGLLEQAPDSAELNLLLGELWVDGHRPEKAVPYLERAVQNDPKRLHAHALLGQAYVDVGEAERALPHLEAALETDEDGSLHFQLARAYQAAGKADLARKTREEFQEIRQANEARAKAEDEEFTITPP